VPFVYELGSDPGRAGFLHQSSSELSTGLISIMELVAASSTSVFKLCAFPSGAGIGDGSSQEPGTAPSTAPQPTVLAKWQPSPGSLTTRPLGEIEALVALEDGVSLISAHKFSDGPGSILFHHHLQLDLVKPSAKTTSSSSTGVSSNGAHSGRKEAKQADPKKNALQPKITPSCLPLGALLQNEDQTTSLHIIAGSNRLVHVLKSGKCCVVDISDISALRHGKKSGDSSSKRKSVESSSDYLVQEFNLEQVVVSTRLNPFNPTLLSVIGPHGTLACVYSMEKKEKVWSARNVPFDTLRMEVPISDMDSDWIDECRLVVVTAHSFVRVYDTREQRRPTLSFSLADEFAKSQGPSKFQQLTKGDITLSLRAVRCNPGKRTEVAVAATTGDVFVLDTTRPASKGHIVSRQKGVQGAVRALVFHPTRQNALVVAGLDRFVRSWDVSKSRSLGTLYTKLRQNCLCFTHVLDPILKTHKQKVREEKKKRKVVDEAHDEDDSLHSSDLGSDVEEDDEGMWVDMKVAKDKKRKRFEGDEDYEEPEKTKRSKHA